MPAVTVPDTLVLPRVADAGRGRAVRPVTSVTDAPAGLRGRGIPGARAPSPACRMAELDPFIHMDQMGEVEYAPGRAQGHAVAPAPWLRDRDLHDRRHVPAPGLHRRRRPHHQRLDAVDDGRVGHPAHRAPARAADRQRRPVPRDPALGEPAVGRQDDRPALPGHRGGQRPAAHLARRRRARPGHRRRRRRPPRARLARTRRSRWCTPPSAGRRARPALARRVQRARLRARRATGTSGPDARPSTPAQLAVHGAGDALVLRADADPGVPPPRARRAHPRRPAHRRAGRTPTGRSS